MARKRKYNQISKKQSLSSSSEKLSEKEEIKHQNKRMKLVNTPDDNKVVFESRRKRKISQSKLNKKSSDAFVFSERSSSPNKSIKNSTVDNSIKPLRYKSNEEILELIEIDEVFTESSWIEIEDIQSEIITALSDKFDIIKEESDGNCMFRTLSRGWFGTPLYHNKIRESICDYIIYHSDRFKDHLPWDINEYIDRMLEDGEWGGEPEIVAFSEIYNTSVHVFDVMTSAIPYLVVENSTSSHSINLLLTNNNHFDLLSIKEKSESKEYRKITKKEFKLKKKAVIKKNEKDHSMKGEQSTIYSKNTYKSIKDYLISGVYPTEILSVEPFEARKQRKRGFRQIIDRDKRYKIENRRIKNMQRFSRFT